MTVNCFFIIFSKATRSVFNDTQLLNVNINKLTHNSIELLVIELLVIELLVIELLVIELLVIELLVIELLVNTVQ